MNNMKTIACLFVNERITEENYIDQKSYDFITKDDIQIGDLLFTDAYRKHLQVVNIHKEFKDTVTVNGRVFPLKEIVLSDKPKIPVSSVVYAKKVDYVKKEEERFSTI